MQLPGSACDECLGKVIGAILVVVLLEFFSSKKLSEIASDRPLYDSTNEPLWNWMRLACQQYIKYNVAISKPPH
jgi:hypothetical protein